MQHIFSRPLRCKVVLISSRRCRKLIFSRLSQEHDGSDSLILQVFRLDLLQRGVATGVGQRSIDLLLSKLFAPQSKRQMSDDTKYLDLHLALFSAHSSFRLDLRSFWLFMLTWTRKRAFVSWRTGIYVFFPGIYAYFPAKYAYNFGFKMHKVQKCLKWCNYAHVEKNRSKSRNLSNEHLFVLFRGCRYVHTLVLRIALVFKQ